MALLALVLGMAPPVDRASGDRSGTASGTPDPSPSPALLGPLSGLLNGLVGGLTRGVGGNRPGASGTPTAPGVSGDGPGAPATPGGGPGGPAKPGRSGTADRAASPEVFTGYGFDTCVAPSAEVMRAWLASPYRAVGVYVGGRGRACPNQPNLTPEWVSEVDAMGWRLLPLYVGSQAPCVHAQHKRHVTIDPSRPGEQGASEGRDAVARARALGLAEGSPLYLDMEAYDHLDPSCAETTLRFVQAWNREVSRQGYLPGFYSSADSGVRHMAAARQDGLPDLPEIMWFARWGVPASVDDDPSLPQDAWRPHRRVHQYAGDVSESYGGHRLDIDRNRVDAPVAVLR